MAMKKSELYSKLWKRYDKLRGKSMLLINYVCSW